MEGDPKDIMGDSEEPKVFRIAQVDSPASSKMDRRTFVKATAASVGVAATAGIVAGCKSDGDAALEEEPAVEDPSEEEPEEPVEEEEPEEPVEEEEPEEPEDDDDNDDDDDDDDSGDDNDDDDEDPVGGCICDSVCTCEAVCSCVSDCSCQSVSSGHYWYPT